MIILGAISKKQKPLCLQMDNNDDDHNVAKTALKLNEK